MEEVSQTLVLNPSLIWLIVWETFITGGGRFVLSALSKCDYNFKEVIALNWPLCLNHEEAKYVLHCRTRGFAVLKILYSRPKEPESSPQRFVMSELLWALNVHAACIFENILQYLPTLIAFILIWNFYIVFVIFQYGRRWIVSANTRQARRSFHRTR
jgi:hypothetical protein